MDISVSHALGRVPVTVIKVDGQLDGHTYRELISKAQELYQSGGRDFLLDMSDLSYMSSAGLVALHTITLLLRGEVFADSENGWASVKEAKMAATGKLQEHVKLFKPREEIKNVLEMVGFLNVFPVFMDFKEAVKSF